MHVDAKALGVDYMTMAGHKIYATKGVGILYIRKDTLCPEKIIHGAMVVPIVATTSDT